MCENGWSENQNVLVPETTYTRHKEQFHNAGKETQVWTELTGKIKESDSSHGRRGCYIRDEDAVIDAVNELD